MDGQRRTCDYPVMSAMEQEEAVPGIWASFVSGEVPIVTTQVNRVDYVHQCFKADGKDFSFWIFVDYLQTRRDVGPRDVVERLIEGYRPVKRWCGRMTVDVDGKVYVLVQRDRS